MSALALLLLLAQTPRQLANLNTDPVNDYNAAPEGFRQAGPVAFFWATDALNGNELWVTDGTDAGTRLVRDLTPGFSSSDKTVLAVLDAGVVVLQQDDRVYVSDGTALGTRPLCCATLGLDDVALLDGQVLLDANAGSTGGLYRVDGSAEGASLVAPVRVTQFLGVLSGRLLFTGEDQAGVGSLYATDGTGAGTVVLTAMRAVAATRLTVSASGVGYLIGSVSLVARLFRTDGTVAGTTDLGALAPVAAQGPAVAAGDLVCFAGNTSGTGTEVYGSSGGVNDVRLISEVRPGTASALVQNLASFSTGALFSATDGTTGIEPWFIDGSDGGVVRLADTSPGTASGNPSAFTPNGARAVFVTSTTQPLWVTDGTPAGTQSLLDAGSSANPAPFKAGWLFSRAVGGIGTPWLTDGTRAGTTQLARIGARSTASSVPLDFTTVGSKVVFSAYGSATGLELFAFDIFDGGVALVADQNAGTQQGVDYVFGELGGKLYVSANDGNTGFELYTTRGQPNDLTLVRDLRPGVNGSFPGPGVFAGGNLYFVAFTPAEGIELWRTDGTSQGTVLVQDLNSGTDDSEPSLLTPLPDGGVVLVATDTVGMYLWRVDPAAGYVKLADDYALRAVAVGPRVFVDLCDLAAGCELWSTDGTRAGTVLWADVEPGVTSGSPRAMTAFGDRLFFIAEDGPNSGVFTASPLTPGATKVLDLGPYGARDYSPLATGANGVFFTYAASPDVGQEPFIADSSGARLLRDIMPGPESSEADEFTPAGRRTFFSAADSEHGRELWVTDGTTAGTKLVADLVPGPASSSPQAFVSASGWLFFSATDALGDEEPWVLPLTENPPAIATQVTGTLGGDGGWYVSDVSVSFTVTDPDVPILASTGCGTSRAPADGGFVGSTVVTSDGPGSVVSCSATSSGGTSQTSVTVSRDATAPRIACPAGIVADATSVSGANVSFPAPVAMDVIDPSPQVTTSVASGGAFPLGRTVVTATATDHVGHVSACNFTVDVRDAKPPVVMCPADVSAMFGEAVSFTATATDELDPMPKVTFSAPSGTVFPPGKNGVSVVAIDAAGNLAACAFYVNVAAGPDGGTGGGGQVIGGCNCGSAPFGGVLLALFVLLRRRRS